MIVVWLVLVAAALIAATIAYDNYKRTTARRLWLANRCLCARIHIGNVPAKHDGDMIHERFRCFQNREFINPREEQV